MKKIGILTSGGDCGGLNGFVKGAAQMANKEGISPYIIPNGYAGLYNLIDFDSLMELTPERADRIDSNLAGSEAGHSRVKIKKINDEQKYERIKEGLKKFNIDATAQGIGVGISSFNNHRRNLDKLKNYNLDDEQIEDLLLKS